MPWYPTHPVSPVRLGRWAGVWRGAAGRGGARRGNTLPAHAQPAAGPGRYCNTVTLTFTNRPGAQRGTAQRAEFDSFEIESQKNLSGRVARGLLSGGEEVERNLIGPAEAGPEGGQMAVVIAPHLQEIGVELDN